MTQITEQSPESTEPVGQISIVYLGPIEPHWDIQTHWGDETALVNTDVRGRSFAPAGKTPVAMAVGGMGVRFGAMRRKLFNVRLHNIISICPEPWPSAGAADK